MNPQRAADAFDRMHDARSQRLLSATRQPVVITPARALRATGVMADRNVARIAVLGPAVGARTSAAFFNELTRLGVSVQAVLPAFRCRNVQAIVGIEGLTQAVRALDAWMDAHDVDDVAIDRGIARITIAGPADGRELFASRLMSALAQEGVTSECVMAIDLGVACLVCATDLNRAMRAAEKEFLTGG